MLNRGLDKVELLRIVEAVANEKSIDKEIVLESMESAIQKAALTKFGTENNIRVIIDRASGEIKIQKVLDIVEKVEDSSKEILLNDVKSVEKEKKDLKVGEQIFEDLPQIDFGRKPTNKGEFSWEKTDKINVFKMWPCKSLKFSLNIVKIMYLQNGL